MNSVDRMAVKRMLIRIFGCRKRDVTERWKEVRSDEFHVLYSSLNRIIGCLTSKKDIGEANKDLTVLTCWTY